MMKLGASWLLMCFVQGFAGSGLMALDFPEYRENIPFSATVAWTNPHDRAVRIKLIDTSCTCTVLDMPQRFVLPGATAPIHVAVDNANRSGPMHIDLTFFFTDPELEVSELRLAWTIRPLVTVDSMPVGATVAERPPRAWQDIMRFPSELRPDEPQRLRKRLRVASPDHATLPGGFQILGVDYAGSHWAFKPRDLGNGVWLVVAGPRDIQAVLPVGEVREEVVLRTNHPEKSKIPLVFETFVSPNVGRQPVDLRD